MSGGYNSFANVKRYFNLDKQCISIFRHHRNKIIIDDVPRIHYNLFQDHYNETTLQFVMEVAKCIS